MYHTSSHRGFAYSYRSLSVTPSRVDQVTGLFVYPSRNLAVSESSFWGWRSPLRSHTSQITLDGMRRVLFRCDILDSSNLSAARPACNLVALALSWTCDAFIKGTYVCLEHTTTPSKMSRPPILWRGNPAPMRGWSAKVGSAIIVVAN